MARRNSICNRRDTTDAQTYLHLAQNFLPESGIQEETHLVERSTKCVTQRTTYFSILHCMSCTKAYGDGKERRLSLRYSNMTSCDLTFPPCA